MPFEDRHVESFLSEDILKASADLGADAGGQGPNTSEGNDDARVKLFSVIDGHAGSAAAELLRATLHSAVTLSLASLYRGYKPDVEDPLTVMRQRGRDVREFLLEHEPFPQDSPIVVAGSSANMTRDSISDALTAAFLQLDYAICSEPLRLISGLPSPLGQVDGKAAIAPATSGACALTVMVDEDREEVYVANTGDCRAVAGYWVEPHTTKDGHHYQGGWRTEVLTEDHTSANPNEIARYSCLVFPLFCR